jgi:hypothetical protein
MTAMAHRTTLLSRLEKRYRRLPPAEMERAKVMMFGMFFCVSTASAMLLGIESARTVGPIAASIAGVEIGGMLATVSRTVLDRFLSK